MMKGSQKSELAKREQRLAYKMLLPTLVILVVVALYPLVNVFVTSFTDKTFASSKKAEFVGFDNYKELLSVKIMKLPKVENEDGDMVYENPLRILPRKPMRYKEAFQFNFFGNRYVFGATNPDFLSSIGNTLNFTIWSVLLETILGLVVAMIVNIKFRGQGTMRTIMLVPWAVITVVSARIWEFMLMPTRVGLFNMIGDWLGISNGSVSFLTNRALQLPTIILVDVWKTTPYMALLLLAGLQIIPGSLYEAAKIDGANKFKQFIYVTLPLLKPALVVALIFRTLDALRVFDLFQILLNNQRYSMATYNYFQLIQAKRMGMSSAIGVLIFILIFVFALIYMKGLGVDSDD